MRPIEGRSRLVRRGGRPVVIRPPEPDGDRLGLAMAVLIGLLLVLLGLCIAGLLQALGQGWG